MEKLYLGIGRRDITPGVGARLFGYQDNVYSKSVNDKLTATAFYFKSGSTVSLIVSASICLFDSDLADTIRDKIESNTGIPSGNIILAATHTHSGPYTASGVALGEREHEFCNGVLIPRILEAVSDAVSDAEAVTVGYSVGESYAAVNRREHTPDGRVKLGQNKDGVFNPKMTVIAFKTERVRIKGTLIHYGMHGTASGMNTEITRDWSGVMTDGIEDITGAPCAFLNGPEGDVGPRLSNGRTAGNITLMKELGEIAASDAKRIYESISDFGDAKMNCLTETITLPVKPRLPLEFVKDELEKYMQDRLVSLGLYWRDHYERVLDSYKTDYEEKSAHTEPQTLIKIGNIVFVAVPYELFAEIGLDIQKGYDAICVLPISNANGSCGYFPTESEIPLGGYETHSFRTAMIQPLANNADKCFVSETKKNIDKLI